MSYLPWDARWECFCEALYRGCETPRHPRQYCRSSSRHCQLLLVSLPGRPAIVANSPGRYSQYAPNRPPHVTMGSNLSLCTQYGWGKCDTHHSNKMIRGHHNTRKAVDSDKQYDNRSFYCGLRIDTRCMMQDARLSILNRIDIR